MSLHGYLKADGRITMCYYTLRELGESESVYTSVAVRGLYTIRPLAACQRREHVSEIQKYFFETMRRYEETGCA